MAYLIVDLKNRHDLNGLPVVIHDIHKDYALVKIAHCPGGGYLKMRTSNIMCPSGRTASHVIADGGTLPLHKDLNKDLDKVLAQRAEEQKKGAMQSFISQMNFTPA